MATDKPNGDDVPIDALPFFFREVVEQVPLIPPGYADAYTNFCRLYQIPDNSDRMASQRVELRDRVDALIRTVTSFETPAPQEVDQVLRKAPTELLYFYFERIDGLLHFLSDTHALHNIADTVPMRDDKSWIDYFRDLLILIGAPRFWKSPRSD
jgi:hypothetical protein